MANFISKLLTAGVGDFADKVAGIVDRFTLTKDEKAQLSLELEKLAVQQATELEETMRQELQAKERIMVAELNQGDTFTKRARPSVVYFGLVLMAWNFALVPVGAWLARAWWPALDVLPTLTLPAEFWYAWGGIVATWSVGRTMERRGSNNNLVQLVTGSKEQARDTAADKFTFKSILD